MAISGLPLCLPVFVHGSQIHVRLSIIRSKNEDVIIHHIVRNNTWLLLLPQEHQRGGGMPFCILNSHFFHPSLSPLGLFFQRSPLCHY